MKHRNSYVNKDISGQRFGRLVAINKVPGCRTRWLFKCDCGNTVELTYSRVLYGTLSCGCMRKESQMRFVDSLTTHGESRTKLYRKYRAMLDRCYRPGTKKYKRYGGRGIKVCDEWKYSYENFKKWAYSAGYDPLLDTKSQSIDRIDNDGDYSPDNCRWTDAKTQAENRSCTTMYPYKGKRYSASGFAKEYGISDVSFVYRRLLIGHQSLEYILEDWNRIHNVPDGLIEVVDYAVLKSVHPATVRRWINEGKLAGEKVGRKWYVKLEDMNLHERY